MIVSQDESVFAQYFLGAKTWWVRHEGQRPLLPKSEGVGDIWIRKSVDRG